MTQFNLPNIDPAVATGTNLADWLNQWKPAMLGSHSGVAAPSYAIAGTPWLDTSLAGTPNFISNFKIYSGSAWVTIGSVSTNSSTWTPANALPATGGGVSGMVTITAPATGVALQVLGTEADFGASGKAIFVVSGTGAAVAANMGFNRNGVAAIKIGLDTDSAFKIGGWSWAAGRLVLDSLGNLTVAGAMHAGANGEAFRAISYATAGAQLSVNMLRGNPNWNDCYHQLIHNSGVDVRHRLTLQAFTFDFINTGVLSRSDGYTAAFNPPSDARIKTNVQPTEVDALDIICRLPISQFDITPEAASAMLAPKLDGTRETVTEPMHVDLGWVAQDVGAVLPQMEITQTLLDTRNGAFPEDLRGVDGLASIPYLIRATQQIVARLAALEGAAP